MTTRLCLLQGEHGILWEHELYEPLSYNQDRTFLHTLEGDEFVVAFAFADDGEASELYKKINNRQKYGKSDPIQYEPGSIIASLTLPVYQQNHQVSLQGQSSRRKIKGLQEVVRLTSR